MSDVLYITQNGLCDHIGRSQVLPYLLGLADRGYPIHLLSLEKKNMAHRFDEFEQLLLKAGIRWTHFSYHNSPPLLSTAYDLFRLYLSALGIIFVGNVKVVHARGFIATIVAFYLKRKTGVRYIYDFRDFYVDSGYEFKAFKFVYRYLKRWDRDFIRAADKVICLTERARDILTEWYLQDQPNPKARFQTIPCCADFQHFDSTQLKDEAIDCARKHAALCKTDFVLLYLGSLHPVYLPEQMLNLYIQLRKLQPNAKFLFVVNNGRDLIEQKCKHMGIQPESIRFVTVDRNDVPAYISLADLSVVFIRPSLSKAGCFPTKLAELFACNIPVIANTGVGDMDQIISLERNGSMIVSDFEDQTLQQAMRKVLAYRESHIINIRENSRVLALEEGVARYAAVYEELLNNKQALEKGLC